MKTIIIAGSLAQKPRQGGHTWVFLQYLLGFKRLGWEVLFLDWLEPEMCMDGVGQQATVETSVNLSYFLDVVQRFGLADSFAVFYNRGERVIGLSRRQVLERARNAVFLLNVMGYCNDQEVLEAVPRRVFLDIDPGFGQMWHALGLADLFQGHDDFVTIGENIGQPGCTIPTCGLQWITTRQPVVLDYWRPEFDVSIGSFSSIGSWRGPNAPIEYQGRTYGLRVHEFRTFASLPHVTGQSFQIALDIHQAEVNDLELLRANEWSLVNPVAVAGDPWAYQGYIRSSKAEFMVAKNMYVQTGSGWFSDRSICYLASGRPVLAQDTGIKHLYPTGQGLLTFSTLDEAVAGVAEITWNYTRHALAARALAEASFDSDNILTSLLSKLGL